jgi:hypothetical protein
VQSSSGGRAPAWVSDPYAAFSRGDYVAATGSGSGRTQAEQNALVTLTGTFGRNLQAELELVSSYNQAVVNGQLTFTDNNSVEEAIRTSTQLNSLLGVEIRAVWDDGKGTFHALAVMEKALARRLYADMLRSNQRFIAEMTNLSATDRNSFDGYVRYRFAGTIADVNLIYAQVLTQVGGVAGIDPAAMKKGDDDRLEAATIARSLPITVQVSQDRGANRIQAAFNSALSAANFRTGRNGRYVLRVTVALEEAVFPSNPNKWCRFNIDANLTDTLDGSVIYPFNITGREGHLTYPEAENAALRMIEREISQKYGQGLTAYLSTLEPQ